MVLGRAVALKMEANKWPMAPPPNSDPESEAYVTAVFKNIENDKRRCQRQQHTFRAGEDGIISDSSGHPFPLPEEDSLIPQLPDGFPVFINHASGSLPPGLVHPNVSVKGRGPRRMKT